MDLAECDQPHPLPRLSALPQCRREPTTIQHLPWISWFGLGKSVSKLNTLLPAHLLRRFDLTLGRLMVALRILLEMTCLYLQFLKCQTWDRHQSLLLLQGKVLD